ncbi:MAG: hypothetical protein PWR06_1631 [Thermoanaerobacteraceae bacterium]|nr:hypothetical protein [Thermoanaerobacteraceae bacterium]
MAILGTDDKKTQGQSQRNDWNAHSCIRYNRKICGCR